MQHIHVTVRLLYMWNFVSSSCKINSISRDSRSSTKSGTFLAWTFNFLQIWMFTLNFIQALLKVYFLSSNFEKYKLVKKNSENLNFYGERNSLLSFQKGYKVHLLLRIFSAVLIFISVCGNESLSGTHSLIMMPQMHPALPCHHK